MRKSTSWKKREPFYCRHKKNRSCPTKIQIYQKYMEEEKTEENGTASGMKML